MQCVLSNRVYLLYAHNNYASYNTILYTYNNKKKHSYGRCFRISVRKSPVNPARKRFLCITHNIQPTYASYTLILSYIYIYMILLSVCEDRNIKSIITSSVHTLCYYKYKGGGPHPPSIRVHTHSSNDPCSNPLITEYNIILYRRRSCIWRDDTLVVLDDIQNMCVCACASGYGI